MKQGWEADSKPHPPNPLINSLIQNTDRIHNPKIEGLNPAFGNERERRVHNMSAKATEVITQKI